MTTDAFDERRRALEEQFFKKQNEALIHKMKEAAARSVSRAEIKALTGISQDRLLDVLADMKLGAAATMVVSAYPLVAVAWADGTVTDKERRVVMAQAGALGIKPGSEASLFLSQWLEERPEESWHQVWADYVGELCARLKPEDRALLKAEVLGRALHVAEASGGVLGKGWSVSAAEKAALATLEKAFG